MDLELKRCPFCHGRSRAFTAFGTKISCRQCGASVYDLDNAVAVAKWNRRCSNFEYRKE